MRKWLLSVLIFVTAPAPAQDTLHTVTNEILLANVNKKDSLQYRKWIVGTGSALLYGGSFIFLNEAWYKGYPRSTFHSFNDAAEWKQMDKIGHSWAAYHTSRVNTALWRWAGVDKELAVWIGSGTSLAYLLGIEYLDGRSAEWGWSWPDVAADVFGTSLFAAQELTWKEQKIGIKFSSYKKNYTPQSLHQRADELFGSSLPERILKDYNAQTYWLTFNLQSLFRTNNLPAWLNIAVGHGADGMFGGFENVAYDKDGSVIFDRQDIQRQRQWYLSADIDLARIKTKSVFLRSVFSILNCIKVPAPALELSNGKIKAHWLHF